MEMSFISDINFQSSGSAFLSLHGRSYWEKLTLDLCGTRGDVGRMGFVFSKCCYSFIQEVLIGQIRDSSRHYINISE